MNDKLTAATIASLLALFAGPACTEQQAPPHPTGAAGAVGTSLPKLDTGAATPNAVTAPVDAKAVVPPGTVAPKVSPQNVKPIDPIQPAAPVQPGELGGARFGLRHRAGRTLVRIA